MMPITVLFILMLFGFDAKMGALGFDAGEK
jgi:hypothetical protein